MRIALPAALMTIACSTLLAQGELPRDGIVTDTSGSAHPWSRLQLNNDPGDFRFAIVGDRSGGHRPGIFGEAVRKLNLLQPEFVIGVGDMIEGYTKDREKIDREWDEFQGLVESLEMPFFYLPGNQDYSNEVMAEAWKQRFGASYYSFLYRDVLFLFLNTEDTMTGWNRGGIGEDQYRYVKNALMKHGDARWTFVFMHQPLWLQDSAAHWKEIEAKLAGRNHTVFAGHSHRYMKYERNNGKYIVLASTGGNSGLRGPDYGEFDEVAWVAMTGEGPKISNLLLPGIWDEDVVTEELSRMIESERMQVEPLFLEDGSRTGEIGIQLNNDSDYPMWTVLRFGQNPYLVPEAPEYRVSLPPDTGEMIKIPVGVRASPRSRNLEPLPLYAWFMYKYKGGREINLERQFSIAPVRKLYFKKSREAILLDGDPWEWTGLPYRAGLESYIEEGRDAYSGDFDAQFDFNLTYDGENLYLAMAVWDDKLELDPGKPIRMQDAVLINLDPRPVLVSANNRTDNRSRNGCFHLLCSPSVTGNPSPRVAQANLLPGGTRIASRKSLEGFTLELSIPLEYIYRLGGRDWNAVRLNIAYFDRDGDDPATAIWWRPNWSADENYIGSGMFYKIPEK